MPKYSTGMHCPDKEKMQVHAPYPVLSTAYNSKKLSEGWSAIPGILILT